MDNTVAEQSDPSPCMELNGFVGCADDASRQGSSRRRCGTPKRKDSLPTAIGRICRNRHCVWGSVLLLAVTSLSHSSPEEVLSWTSSQVQGTKLGCRSGLGCEGRLFSGFSPLRLRGGHRMPNAKKRNALEQHRTSRRLHSATRIKPRDLRRMQEKKAAAEKQREDAVPANITEILLNIPKPKPRLWESTFGELMNNIHEFKKRCPEVWEEELACRRDGEANVFMEEWREFLEVPEDEDEARQRDQDDEWRRKRAIAHYNLAMCYEIGYYVESVDLVKAFAHYKAAGELGHSEGMCNVGCCYLSARGCAYDEERGLSWVRKAAEAGSFEGQLNLGLCYRRGVGVAADPAQALKWMNVSASNKHPDAMYAVAMCHMQGIAVPPNPALAVSLLSRVVDKYDHPPSLLSLGKCFMSGQGVSAAPDMGLKLVAMAAKLGMPEAREELERRLPSAAASAMAVDAGGEVDGEVMGELMA